MGKILREAFKIFFRSGKLLPSVTLAYVCMNSLLCFFFLFATKHLATDHTMKTIIVVLGGTCANKNSYLQIINLMKHEARLFLVVYLVYLTFNAITSFIFSLAAISGSTEKKLGEKVIKSWQRVIVIVSYTVLLNLGFALVISAFVVLPIDLILFNYTAEKISASSNNKEVIVVAMSMYFHLAIVWIITLVVSVVEEKSDVRAFYRVSGLFKELKLQSFVANVVFGDLSHTVYKSFRASLGVDRRPGLMAIMAMNIAPIALLMVVDSVVMAFTGLSELASIFQGRKIFGKGIMQLKEYTVEY